MRATELTGGDGTHTVLAVPTDFGVFLRNITVTGGVAPARAYIEELLPDILEGRIEPGRVFDRTVTLEKVPAGYQAMADRKALKVMIES